MADTNSKKKETMNQCLTCGNGMINRCCCGYQGMGWGMGGSILRIIIGLIILGIVFSVGVLIGELKMTVQGERFMHRGMIIETQGNYPSMGITPSGTTTTK